MEFLGLFLPPLIDLINRKIADSDKRFWVSFLICALVGAFMNWIDTSFSFLSPRAAFDSISASIAMVFSMAQLSYKAVWETSQARRDLDLEGGSQV